MLIDRIYRKVQYFLNTELRGNLDPGKFNGFLHNAIQSRIEEYIYDMNRGINDQNRGNMNNYLNNLPDRLAEKLQHYSKTEPLIVETVSIRKLPTDYRYIDAIGYPDVDFEKCRNKKEFNISKLDASLQFPIFYIGQGKVHIYPEYGGTIEATYLRNPLIPKWTYQDLGSGQYGFDSGINDFVDADIHPSEEDEMVRRVLMYSGVNLKETDIQQFAMAEEQSEFRNNNTD